MTSDSRSLDGKDKKPLGTTWYRVSSSGIEIEEVKVTRTTSANVWYMVTGWSGKPEERKAKKMDVLDLCKMMGWKDPRMAMRYYKSNAEELAHRLN